MSLTTLIIVVIIALVVLLFIFFPGFRSLFKGFTNLLIKDIATTPEGAEAVYEEKIRDAQEAYNKANDAFRIAAGKLSNAKRDYDSLQNRLKKVESECEAFVKNNKIDLAKTKVEEREEILADIKRCQDLIAAYTTAEKETREMQQMCEDRLKKLKKESREVVENMKVKQQLKEVYDDMDELKNVKATDKLLDSIREKNSNLNAEAEGSRVVHENRTSTKIQRADEEAKKLQNNDYLEGLRKKYNK